MSQTRPLLIVATGNAHKTEEIRAMLGDRFEVKDLSSYPEVIPAEETGVTFAENAALKAVGVSTQVEGIILSDDSGLEVDVIGGEPGVRSARYSGENADDASNRARLAEVLSVLDEGGPWVARFRCAMTIACGGQVLGECDGAVEGKIYAEERGDGGFGYDPMFVPDGFEQTFAELPSEKKNELSHRARALDKATALLADLDSSGSGDASV